MRYPSPDDYVKAVQHRDSFTTSELARMELVVHPIFQIPMPAAGSSAVVFKATMNSEPQALRFFTREDNWSGERYGALHQHFATRDLAGSVAMPEWINDGIRVNGKTWPVVRMQWVEGHTLNKYVDDLVQQKDTRSLGTLAGDWLELVGRLQRAEFAHGDLQHGNVLVDERGDMRLVDFDCSWIESFSGGTAPGETGHRNYQLETRPWGRWMDTFPGLVIYLSLLALSKNPSQWPVLHTGENLLFRNEDFRPPFHTAAWEYVSSIQDRELDQLALHLKDCCQKPGWVATGGLAELLGPREVPWWERTKQAPVVSMPEQRRAPLPPPAPEPWPIPRQAPTPRPAQPAANWWTTTQRTPTPRPSAPKPSARPSTKPSAAGVIVLAFFLGLVVFGVIGALAEKDGESPAIGIFPGLIALVITMIVGFRKRRRRR